MVGNFCLLMTCLAWGLFLKPGVHTRLSLTSPGNVISRLSQEMDAPTSEDELTPLDELCLICLTEKYVHLEHCKVCNKCVKHFHLHSRFFNKCFGDANIRPYLLFYSLSFVSTILYLYLMGKYYWEAASTSSDSVMGKFMLMHTEMDLSTLSFYI